MSERDYLATGPDEQHIPSIAHPQREHRAEPSEDIEHLPVNEIPDEDGPILPAGKGHRPAVQVRGGDGCHRAFV